MVTYTETAILKLKEQGVNSKLRRLVRTMRDLDRAAAKLSNMKIEVNGLASANRRVTELRTNLGKLRNKSLKISASVDTTGIHKANAAIAAIDRSIITNVNVKVNKKVYNDAMAKIKGAEPVITTVLDLNTADAYDRLAQFRKVASLPVYMPLVPSASAPQGNFAGGGSNNNNNTRRPAIGAQPRIGGSVIGRTLGRAARVPGYAIGGEAYLAGRTLLTSAVMSPINEEDAVMRLRAAGRTEEEAEFLHGLASGATEKYRALSTANLLNSLTEVTGFMDLSKAEDRRAAELAVNRIGANSQSLIGNLGLDSEAAAEEARKIEKIVQQLGAQFDPERAGAISKTVMQAMISSGGDLSVQDLVNMLRQMGGSIKSEIGLATLGQISLMRDEGGRMGTAEARMMMQDMVRSDLNQADLKAQKAAGLRNANGESLIVDEFANDMFGAFDKYMKPRMAAAGLSSESDLGTLMTFFDETMGFTGPASRLLVQLAKQSEELNAAYKKQLDAEPDFVLRNPTTSLRAREVQARFTDMMAKTFEEENVKLGTSMDKLATFMEGKDLDDLNGANFAEFANNMGGALREMGFANIHNEGLNLSNTLMLFGGLFTQGVGQIVGAMNALSVKFGFGELGPIGTVVAGGAVAGGAVALGSGAVRKGGKAVGSGVRRAGRAAAKGGKVAGGWLSGLVTALGGKKTLLKYGSKATGAIAVPVTVVGSAKSFEDSGGDLGDGEAFLDYLTNGLSSRMLDNLNRRNEDKVMSMPVVDSIADERAAIESSVDRAATEINGIPSELASAAVPFGQAAGQQLQSTASSWGASAGAAFASTVQGIKIGVDTGGLDTGSTAATSGNGGGGGR